MVNPRRSAFSTEVFVVSAIDRANFYRANLYRARLYRARLCRAVAALAIVATSAGPAFAQTLSFAPAFRSDPVLPQYAPQQQDDPSASEQLPAQLRRQMVTYPSNEAPGTIIIDTGHTFLYLTLGHGMAMR